MNNIVLYAWTFTFLLLLSGRGWFAPILMILLGIGWVIFEKWAECAWFNYSLKKANEIIEKRNKRGKNYKKTFKTRWVNFWEDVIFGTDSCNWE